MTKVISLESDERARRQRKDYEANFISNIQERALSGAVWHWMQVHPSTFHTGVRLGHWDVRPEGWGDYLEWGRKETDLYFSDRDTLKAALKHTDGHDYEPQLKGTIARAALATVRAKRAAAGRLRSFGEVVLSDAPMTWLGFPKLPARRNTETQDRYLSRFGATIAGQFWVYDNILPEWDTEHPKQATLLLGFRAIWEKIYQ